MQLDLVSSAGDPHRLRAWLAEHRKLRALMKQYGLHRTRRPGWSAEQRAIALEAVDGLPKAIRRANWIRKQGKAPPSTERQGQARIKLLIRLIDALVGQKRSVEPPRSGSDRDDLLDYLNGSGQPATWRTLVRMLSGDLLLAVRLRDFCDYAPAEALVALQPWPRLSERIEWLLWSPRYQGRFHPTLQRQEALLRLRAALQQLPGNARAGRSDVAQKPLIRAGVLAWTAFGNPVDFTFGRPATARKGARHVSRQLSGAIIDFLRDLLSLAEVTQPTDAALNQMLRVLRSV